MTEPKQRRQPDPELQTMARIDRLLSEHDEPSRMRILDWLNSRNLPFTKGTVVADSIRGTIDHSEPK